MMQYPYGNPALAEADDDGDFALDEVENMLRGLNVDAWDDDGEDEATSSPTHTTTSSRASDSSGNKDPQPSRAIPTHLPVNRHPEGGLSSAFHHEPRPQAHALQQTTARPAAERSGPAKTALQTESMPHHSGSSSGCGCPLTPMNSTRTSSTAPVTPVDAGGEGLTVPVPGPHPPRAAPAHSISGNTPASTMVTRTKPLPQSPLIRLSSTTQDTCSAATPAVAAVNASRAPSTAAGRLMHANPSGGFYALTPTRSTHASGQPGTPVSTHSHMPSPAVGHRSPPQYPQAALTLAPASPPAVPAHALPPPPPPPPPPPVPQQQPQQPQQPPPQPPLVNGAAAQEVEVVSHQPDGSTTSHRLSVPAAYFQSQELLGSYVSAFLSHLQQQHQQQQQQQLQQQQLQQQQAIMQYPSNNASINTNANGSVGQVVYVNNQPFRVVGTNGSGLVLQSLQANPVYASQQQQQQQQQQPQQQQLPPPQVTPPPPPYTMPSASAAAAPGGGNTAAPPQVVYRAAPTGYELAPVSHPSGSPAPARPVMLPAPQPPMQPSQSSQVTYITAQQYQQLQQQQQQQQQQQPSVMMNHGQANTVTLVPAHGGTIHSQGGPQPSAAAPVRQFIQYVDGQAYLVTDDGKGSVTGVPVALAGGATSAPPPPPQQPQQVYVQAAQPQQMMWR